MKMNQEMFYALLAIMDAKIAEHAARKYWDGGLSESIAVNELVDEFKEKFVVREDD